MRLPTCLAVPAICLLLSACATPQQRCVGQITQDLETVDALIIETERTLARGYSYRTEPVGVGYGLSFCTGSYDSGFGVNFCSGGANDVRRVPVAIDREIEQRKLADLRTQKVRLQSALPEAQRACAERYPQ